MANVEELPLRAKLGLYFPADVDDGILADVPEPTMRAVRWLPEAVAPLTLVAGIFAMTKRSPVPLWVGLRGQVHASLPPKLATVILSAAAAGIGALGAYPVRGSQAEETDEFCEDTCCIESGDRELLSLANEACGSECGCFPNDRAACCGHHESGCSNDASGCCGSFCCEPGNERKLLARNSTLVSLSVGIAASLAAPLYVRGNKASWFKIAALSAASLAIEPVIKVFVTREGLKHIS